MSGRVTLKKVSVNEALSQETTCFSAEVYVDGKHIAKAVNRGDGACNSYYPVPDGPARPEQILHDIAAAEADAPKFEPEDRMISRLLDIALLERDLLRTTRSRVSFIAQDSSIMESSPFPPAVIARTGRYPGEVFAQIPNVAVVLNALPVREAAELMHEAISNPEGFAARHEDLSAKQKAQVPGASREASQANPEAERAPLPEGYHITYDAPRGVYRLWRDHSVEPTADGHPDEIEDGFPSWDHAAQCAHECAEARQVQDRARDNGGPSV